MRFLSPALRKAFFARPARESRRSRAQFIFPRQQPAFLNPPPRRVIKLSVAECHALRGSRLSPRTQPAQVYPSSVYGRTRNVSPQLACAILRVCCALPGGDVDICTTCAVSECYSGPPLVSVVTAWCYVSVEPSPFNEARSFLMSAGEVCEIDLDRAKPFRDRWILCT